MRWLRASEESFLGKRWVICLNGTPRYFPGGRTVLVWGEAVVVQMQMRVNRRRRGQQQEEEQEQEQGMTAPSTLYLANASERALSRFFERPV